MLFFRHVDRDLQSTHTLDLLRGLLCFTHACNVDDQLVNPSILCYARVIHVACPIPSHSDIKSIRQLDFLLPVPLPVIGATSLKDLTLAGSPDG